MEWKTKGRNGDKQRKHIEQGNCEILTHKEKSIVIMDAWTLDRK